jgi:hypothetical protein
MKVSSFFERIIHFIFGPPPPPASKPPDAYCTKCEERTEKVFHLSSDKTFWTVQHRCSRCGFSFERIFPTNIEGDR